MVKKHFDNLSTAKSVARYAKTHASAKISFHDIEFASRTSSSKMRYTFWRKMMETSRQLPSWEKYTTLWWYASLANGIRSKMERRNAKDDDEDGSPANGFQWKVENRKANDVLSTVAPDAALANCFQWKMESRKTGSLSTPLQISLGCPGPQLGPWR